MRKSTEAETTRNWVFSGRAELKFSQHIVLPATLESVEVLGQSRFMDKEGRYRSSARTQAVSWLAWGWGRTISRCCLANRWISVFCKLDIIGNQYLTSLSSSLMKVHARDFPFHVPWSHFRIEILPNGKTQTFKSQICMHKQWWYDLDRITGCWFSCSFCPRLLMQVFWKLFLVILTHHENGKQLCPVKRETSQPKLPVIPFWVDCFPRKIPSSSNYVLWELNNIWDRDMKRGDAVGEMAQRDLLHSGLPQTFSLWKAYYLWSAIKQSRIKKKYAFV